MSPALSRRSLLATATLPLLPRAARSAPITVGVVYAIGEKLDGSFNEQAFRAHEAFARDTGATIREYQPAQLAEMPRGLDALIRRGCDPVTAVGFYYAEPLREAAAASPAVRFNLVDAVVEAANVRSLVFKEHEGSFLVGVLAAMAAERGVVGFVAAMDIPLINRFVAGFEQGVRHARPDATVLVNYVGTTPAAFNDPSTAAELTRAQIGRGAEVVFAGAGNGNFGVFQAAKELGALAIGVDSNQNGVAPGTILTSMLKRVDRAVRAALDDAAAGTWQGGVQAWGVAEDGVGWALDDHNRGLVSAAMEAAVEDARKRIAKGEIVVRETRG